MDEHPALRDPELAFLDECIAVLQALNARTAALIAEYDRLKKRAQEQSDIPAPMAESI